MQIFGTLGKEIGWLKEGTEDQLRATDTRLIIPYTVIYCESFSSRPKISGNTLPSISIRQKIVPVLSFNLILANYFLLQAWRCWLGMRVPA